MPIIITILVMITSILGYTLVYTLLIDHDGYSVLCALYSTPAPLPPALPSHPYCPRLSTPYGSMYRCALGQGSPY